MVTLLGVAHASPHSLLPEIQVQARLGFVTHEIEGAAEIRWRNPGPEPTRTLRLLLFANRFRTIDGFGDLQRHLLVAGGEFHPGGTDILAVRDGERSLAWRFEESGALPHDTVMSVDLGQPIAPGEEVRATIEFRTRLPNLLDTFGSSDGLMIADGGWYPQPLTLDSAPSVRAGLPPRAHTRAALELPEGSSLLLNGKLFEQVASADLAGGEDDRLSIVLSNSSFSAQSFRVGGRTVRIYSTPSRKLAHRVSLNQAALSALVDTLPAILSDLSDVSNVSSAPGEEGSDGDLTLVRLPFRWYPSASAPGMVLISDRLFEIFPVLRPLHQRELAYAIFLAEEQRAASEREPAEDAGWVAEGLAWRRAQALYESRFREGREVKDWIRLFRLFGIVDRFETAPRIPFVRPFFPVTASDDPLRIRLETCCGAQPPGRFLFDKLEAKLRPERFGTLIERYRSGHDSMRSLVRSVGGAPAEALLVAWLRPPAAVNYALEDVLLNPGGRPGAEFRVVRESGESRPDTLEIGLEKGEHRERAFVDLEGSETEVRLPARAPVRSVTLDPERHTVETRLDDGRQPAELQLVLGSADVEVSSTEVGYSTLLVGRRRYDYRKDLALAGFYTSRGYGMGAGFQLHGGQPLDANVYRQNLFAYYSLQQLDASFENKQAPEVRTHGRLGGFGLRFNSYDPSWFENPASDEHLRLFFDDYDRALGSDFDFVQGGASLSVTRPLRHDTVLAGQVLNGLSAATARGPIPNQGLFSLGGFRSIRGIGAEEDLGKDILLVRAEIRHMLPYRLDWNLQELLIARRVQLKAFVDAGRVEGSTRKLYDPSGFAVGVGGGLNLFYDFMGFFPTTLYLDVATRADKRGGAQVLFGVGQPF